MRYSKPWRRLGRRRGSLRASSPSLFGVARPTEETMKAMKHVVAAVNLLAISTMAPVEETQQGVEKAAPATWVAPAETLNSPLNMTEYQMISGAKAFPADRYGFAPGAAIFANGQQTESRASARSGHGSFTSRRPPMLWART